MGAKITPEYLELNRKLHATGDYGVVGSKWAPVVLQFCDMLKTRDILDYGCGQRTLEKTLGFPIRNYDPCIPGLDTPPEPADFVACTDVLEHIEPECLDAVLDDLRALTREAALFVIANRPARKVLADGRNAHLIQEGMDWWLPKLSSRFRIHQAEGTPQELVIVVRRKLFGNLAVY
jgi:methyltransferase family protein